MIEESRQCVVCSKELVRKLNSTTTAQGVQPVETRTSFSKRLTCGSACLEELKTRTWSEEKGVLYTPTPSARAPSPIPSELRMGRRRRL